MPNHWHLVLWPEHDGDLGFMHRLTVAHVRRWRLRTSAARPSFGSAVWQAMTAEELGWNRPFNLADDRETQIIGLHPLFLSV
jgi:REP element-mobilizing transposase RayT